VLAAAALLVLACEAGSERDPRGVVVLSEARLWRGAHDLPPPEGPDEATQSAWWRVELPDVWRLGRRSRATAGWYRAELTLPAQPEGLYAVTIALLFPSAEVRVNGQVVGRRGDPAHPGTQPWRQPFYATFPGALLRAGPNQVEVRFATRRDAIGVVGPITLGPDAALHGGVAVVDFFTGTLGQVFSIVALTMASALAFAGARRGASAAYFWFAAGLALWSIASLNAVGSAIPVVPGLAGWIGSVAFQAFLPCFALGFRRALERPIGRVDWLLVGAIAGHAVLRAVVPPLFAVAVDMVWLPIAFAIALHLVQLIFEATRRRVLVGGQVLAAAAVIGLFASVHDLVSLFTGHALIDFPLWTLVPPLAIVVALALQSLRMGEALAESREANLLLEQRVAEKAQELEQNYAVLRRFEAERAVIGERERLLRDMHDGLGGHLVSMLASVESEGAPASQVADGLRGALEELRLLIDSLDPAEPDLLAVLGGLRSRLEPRLARAGMRFDWRVRDVPQLRDFGPWQVLQVLRVVQEAITNVTKHAGARTIAVRTGESAGPDGRPGVFVEVLDDGRGLSPGAPPGRGLGNMRKRAAELGGDVEIAPAGGGGTRVRLWLPL